MPQDARLVVAWPAGAGNAMVEAAAEPNLGARAAAPRDAGHAAWPRNRRRTNVRTERSVGASQCCAPKNTCLSRSDASPRTSNALHDRVCRRLVEAEVLGAQIACGDILKELERQLEANERTPRRDRLSLLRIYEDLAAQGYEGGYDAVRRYAKAWRRRRRLLAPSEAYVPLSFDPGEAYQFDWSHEYARLSGATTRVKAAHMRLCYSRMQLVQIFPRESQEMVFVVRSARVAARRPRALLPLLRRGLPAGHLRQHDAGGGADPGQRGACAHSCVHASAVALSLPRPLPRLAFTYLPRAAPRTRHPPPSGHDRSLRLPLRVRRAPLRRGSTPVSTLRSHLAQDRTRTAPLTDPSSAAIARPSELAPFPIAATLYAPVFRLQPARRPPGKKAVQSSPVSGPHRRMPSATVIDIASRIQSPDTYPRRRGAAWEDPLHPQ